MNRTYPQNIDTDSLGSTKFHLTDKKAGATLDQPDCCRKCFSWTLCTRRCICVSAISFIILGIIIAIIALTVTVGIPPPTPGQHVAIISNEVNRLCVTTNKQTGFLCDNRETCISASEVCDRRQNCANGEDEQEALCSDLPKSLPGHLIFYCKNRRLWIYADKRCNGFNDCGDCSDEIGSQANCPPCGPESWSCTLVVFYDYCTCIPRSFCRDGIQHCFDWSDEYLCTR